MSGPTGLIFAMRSQYNNQSDGREAFFNEPDTAFSAQNVNGMNLNQGDYTGGTDVEHQLVSVLLVIRKHILIPTLLS